MSDIYNPFIKFILIYIDDVLVFFESIDQHFKHLNIFLDVIEKNGLVISQKKMPLFQVRIRFLGYYVFQLTIPLIERVIQFTDKFHY